MAASSCVAPCSMASLSTCGDQAPLSMRRGVGGAKPCSRQLAAFFCRPQYAHTTALTHWAGAEPSPLQRLDIPQGRKPAPDCFHVARTPLSSCCVKLRRMAGTRSRSSSSRCSTSSASYSAKLAYVRHHKLTDHQSCMFLCSGAAKQDRRAKIAHDKHQTAATLDTRSASGGSARRVCAHFYCCIGAEA